MVSRLLPTRARSLSVGYADPVRPTSEPDPIMTEPASSEPAPLLSVVIPVHDEADSIGPLLAEIVAVLRPLLAFEIIVIDDGSRDATSARLGECRLAMPELRILRHAACSGQSAALCSGIDAARADWIVTLDGDGQNDPADIPRLLAARDRAVESGHADDRQTDHGQRTAIGLVCGWRIHRLDPASKRLASRIANAVRRRMLHDDSPDTGCGLKLIERRAFLALPRFDHMHRYLPALIRRAGRRTLDIPVGHRPRVVGRSKYGNWQRAWVGLFDLIGVAWLIRRTLRPHVEELPPP